jgi:hypothetical protein
VHVLELDVAAASVQVVNEPEPLLARLTNPPGLDFVPGADVSVTVAVHVVGWVMMTDDGLQTTLVEVVRRATATLEDVPALERWTAEPL